MDAKLERLSSSVSDKFQEAEHLNQHANDLEKQIESIRQCNTSPKKLSLQKLELASIQVKLASVLESKSKAGKEINSTNIQLEECESTLKELESSFASIVQAMEFSAQQVAHHRQVVSDIHKPLREQHTMQEEELRSLRAELHEEECQADGYSNKSLSDDQGCSNDELGAIKRKVAIAKLERSEAERMLESLEREHASFASSSSSTLSSSTSHHTSPSYDEQQPQQHGGLDNRHQLERRHYSQDQLQGVYQHQHQHALRHQHKHKFNYNYPYY